MMKFLLNFYRFSRFHTIIGTSLSVGVLYFIASQINFSAEPTTWLLIKTLIACLGANIYIVGLNQITDIEIDKINKPFLPLASGEFSLRTGYLLVGLGLIISLLFAFTSGPFLIATVLLSLALGTAYSLPPFRLKRFHFWAAFCIIAVRGLIVNILLYLHFQYQLTRDTELPLSIILLTTIMFAYSLIIAWFKDIPDMQGDAQHQIKTMSLRLGAERIFRLGNIFLSITLVFAALISFFITTGLHPLAMAIIHGLLLLALWTTAARTQPDEKDSIRKYYLFIWTLFFAEYFGFALAVYL